MIPPFTPSLSQGVLKSDFNYHFAISDEEVDRQAREQPHGHVHPRSDGLKAKCTGSPKICGVCRREAEIFQAREDES